ncbi:MAG: hypothetical protein Ct9H300mP5_4600 [Candidatus Pelagibacterales bacterium]|nr:MAG: hypothetical protein Ct9H300mP5_4600 [Pelagibacterales bacterium]
MGFFLGSIMQDIFREHSNRLSSFGAYGSIYKKSMEQKEFENRFELIKKSRPSKKVL